jgi:peptidoglycan/LPS O-acetylase OafA/YrhL
MNRPSHLASLDGLRGLAILLVIAHNVELIDAPDMSGALKLADYLLNLGWIGVQLFFVLSGFLITGILLDTAGKPGALRNFIVRRALRIFPLYYGALFVIFVLLPHLGAQPAMYQAQAPYQIWLWTYLSNWTDPIGHNPVSLPHFWSLAVEEQFYLFWPLLVFGLTTPTRVAMACLIVGIVGPVSRALTLNAGLPIDAAYCWTHCRIDALALGGFAAACWRVPAWVQWLRAHHRAVVAALATVFVGGALWTHGFPRTSPHGMIVGYSVLAIVFAVITYAAASLDNTIGLAAKPIWHRILTRPGLRTIGKYSYGMYVIHKPLHDLFSATVLARLHVATAGNIPGAFAHIGGVTLASFLAAWVSYNLYEVHFLKLKRHFA